VRDQVQASGGGTGSTAQLGALYDEIRAAGCGALMGRVGLVGKMGQVGKLGQVRKLGCCGTGVTPVTGSGVPGPA
jgi:hypothetical protein